MSNLRVVTQVLQRGVWIRSLNHMKAEYLQGLEVEIYLKSCVPSSRRPWNYSTPSTKNSQSQRFGGNRDLTHEIFIIPRLNTSASSTTTSHIGRMITY
jgi:hypothetical protein